MKPIVNYYTSIAVDTAFIYRYKRHNYQQYVYIFQTITDNFNISLA